MDTGIKTPDLTLSRPWDEAVTNVTENGIRRTRRTSREDIAIGVLSAAAITSNRVYELKSSLALDLSPAARTPALVVGDPTPGNDGLYMKVGAANSGSWNQRTDFVPGAQFVLATDVGAGTANAIKATTNLAVSASGRQLVRLNVYRENTGSPVTVTFNNNLGPLTIKTSAGFDVAAAGLQPGGALGYVEGSTFRLTSQQVSDAIIAQAEAAADRAEAARDAALAAVPNAFPLTISALGSLDTTVNISAYLLAGGREGQFKRVLAADYTALIAADTGNGIIKQSTFDATYAWLRVERDEYYAKWFGAKEDGLTNDSAAIQAAVNVCLLNTRPVPLVVTNTCKLSTAINVNRQVGTSAGADTFFIRGRGQFAGFSSLLTGAMFDTTLAWIAPFNNTPACNITFESITFLGLGNTNTLCVSPKFLKVSFETCRFNIVRITQSPYYLQSWYFNRCSAIAWEGWLVQAADELYDFRVHNCDFESGENGFKSFNAGVYGGSLIGNLFQNGGQFFSQGKGEGLAIIGNYCEFNSEPDFQLSDPVNVGSHHGTVFEANFMGQAGHTGYCVLVGDAKGFKPGGNSCLNANMYDTQYAVPGSFKSVGDSVTGLVGGLAAEKFSVLGSFDGDGAGNFQTASLASGSATSLTTGVAKTICSFTLEAGDYDVSGMVGFLPGATTSETAHVVSISTVNNTHGSSIWTSARAFAAVVTSGFETDMPTPVVRLTPSTTTTYHLVASANFTVSTMTAYGRVNVRRAGGL